MSEKEIRLNAQLAEDLWNETARMQGLVCLVCGNAPLFSRRSVFYDTGLCRRCACDLGIPEGQVTAA